MTLNNFLIRFGGFVLIALAALPLFAVTVNALIYFEMIPPELGEKGYGGDMTKIAMFVWMGCLVLGAIAIFVQQSWAKIFYFSPLYAPSLFAVVYTVSQNP